MRLARLVFALALASVVLSCSRKAPVGADRTASRVVSLSPSTTETMFAIGAGDSVVGRSRFCDWPPEAQRIPQVGGYVDPNFETILALRPDLVVGARGPSGLRITEQLAGRGITTYFPESESFAQIDEMIVGLGERTAHTADAQSVVHAMHARAEVIARAVAGLPKPRVLIVFGLDPVHAAGKQTFADEMIARAGGINVITEGGAYPQLGMERVLALQIDVILNCAVSEAHGAERITPESPGWSGVRAVKEGHVIAIKDERVLRPGPRVVEGLAIVARALHPDAQIP